MYENFCFRIAWFAFCMGVKEMEIMYSIFEGSYVLPLQKSLFKEIHVVDVIFEQKKMYKNSKLVMVMLD